MRLEPPESNSLAEPPEVSIGYDGVRVNKELSFQRQRDPTQLQLRFRATMTAHQPALTLPSHWCETTPVVAHETALGERQTILLLTGERQVLGRLAVFI